MGCNTSQELDNPKLCDNDEIGSSNNENNEDQIDVNKEVKKTHKQNIINLKNVPSALINDDNDCNSDKKDKFDNQQIKRKIIGTNQTDALHHVIKAPITTLENEIDFENNKGHKAIAATKIQAVFRGHKVRATMKKSENMPNKSATKESNQEQNDSNNDVEPTKEELEAEFDPNDKELCDAALKIQATFRGHLSRKIVKDPEDVDIDEITKKVAEELDIDLSDPELNKAATKIQASFRGHKIRKDVTN